MLGRALAVALAAALALPGFPRIAFADDSASLQVTVPAPDPVQAGEVITFQTLAVNTGTEVWGPGSYYWEAEVYDLEYRFIAKTDSSFPQDSVSPGGVSSAFLRFSIPDSFIGRRLYRVFLVRNGRRLIESEYKPFQVIEHALQPPPPPPVVEKYKLGGNFTESIKASSRDKYKKPSGATTVNMVGKLGSSSFLFNTYLLHRSDRFIDPFIILFVYYAPWGTISVGDVSPSVSPLSVYGQGMRGAVLEQQKGRFHWMLLGGRTVAASPGSPTVNGRYQRLLFGAKGEAEFFDSLKFGANYILGTDDVSSLSADPNSARFRGPSLTPQKNPVYGVTLTWDALSSLQFLADYQKSTFQEDSTSSAKPTRSGSAWRGEVRWQSQRIKSKLWVQRTSPDFRSFGSPNTIPDRMTQDLNLNVFPWPWWSVSAAFNQYQDNLANDPSKVTTTQRIMSGGNTFQLPIGTILNLSYSLNTAQAKPRTAQDNQTTTMGMGITQNFKGQSVNLGYQMSQFKDKNRVAHDLDTQTMMFNTTWSFFQRLSAALGTSQSTTKDKVDSSKRKNQSYSASFGLAVVPKVLALQIWGTAAFSKNDSPSFPSDQKTTTGNMEWTYNLTQASSLTLGAGLSQTKDKTNPANDFKETTGTMRFSYSF